MTKRQMLDVVEGDMDRDAMSPADFYFDRAIEFLLLADKSSDLKEREALRTLAFCWLRLSERADEYWQQKQHKVAA